MKLRTSGCPTIAQDEATSLVYGMPAAAVATGCIDRVAALSQIPQAIVALMARAGARFTRPVIATATAARIAPPT
jgi:chemotaxis response regulator CheB